MKARTYTQLAFAILVIFVIVWFFGHRVPKSPSQAALAVTSTNNSLPAMPPQISTRKELINKAAAMQQGWAFENKKPLDFYGKLVDQNGNPVVGASVVGNIMYLAGYTSSRDEIHKVITDSDGLFQFINNGLHGSRLGVIPSKSGYEYNLRSKSNWTEDYKPDPENPVKFIIWKLRGPEPMVRADIDSYIPCDGSTVSFDLLTGKKVSSGGDLTVKLLRNPVEILQGQHFDWTLTLKIANGGMIEFTDIYPYEAPADSYLSTIITNVLETATDWTPQFVHSFYFRCRNGKVFGRMAVYAKTDFPRPPTYFGLKIYANPAGSRNLEFDPAKQINR